MNWFRKMMIGRYGSDQLSLALLILSILLTFISGISPWLGILTYISFIPLALSLLRMFSKDINKRRMENYKFMMLISPLYAKFKKTLKRFNDNKTHRYYTCPNCKQQLRVPKGKGKIRITCPKCRIDFIRKT